MKKNIRILKIMLLMAVLMLLPGLGASADSQLRYLYLGTVDQGKTTGVAVSVSGEEIREAYLNWGKNSTPASEIKKNTMLFFLPSGEVNEKHLKSLTLVTDRGEEILDLTKTLKNSEKMEASLDGGTGMSRSRGAELSGAEKAQVSGLTAEGSSGIAQALSLANGAAGSLSRSKKGDIVVVLDPGHGGSEEGAIRTWDGVTYSEKAINLKISKATMEELSKYAGVQVYMTRTTDQTMSLEERVNFGASKKATVFISQHINSTANYQDTISGAMVFVPSGNYRPDLKGDAWELGQAILNELKSLGLDDRGLVKTMSQNNTLYPDGSLADYYGIIRRSVLAGFPGIIVEHGFVNNPEDCVKYYGSDSAIKKMGIQDARAIAKYYGLKKKTSIEGSTPAGGFQQIGNFTYYIDENGNKVTGTISLEGQLYHMDRYGRLKHGWYKSFDGNRYYSDENGVLQTGFVERNGKTYYFDPKTGAMKKGLQTIEGSTYYFKNGVMQNSGFQRVGKYRYYFQKNGQAKTGILFKDGQRYWFLDDGKMVKSKWIYYHNHWYFASAKGRFYQKTNHYIYQKTYRFNYRGICTNAGDYPLVPDESKVIISGK
jgi:N-acetylmuramoyl-L-alanine amidase